MFEYLMPALVMHAPAGSLLDQTYRRHVYSAEIRLVNLSSRKEIP
jgi:hypothetical protein